MLGRAGTGVFQYQAVEHSPEGYTFIYPKTYDRLLMLKKLRSDYQQSIFLSSDIHISALMQKLSRHETRLIHKSTERK
jgi:hypothetical protein